MRSVLVTRRLSVDLQAAFGAMGNPLFDLIIYWGCAAIAAPLAMWGGEFGALAGTIVFSLAILFLAYSLGHGMLSFAAQMRETRLPGDVSLTRRYSAYACMLLAAAGAIPILALSTSHLWLAWVPVLLILAVALVCILAPRPSIAAVLMLCVVCVAYWQLRAHTSPESATHLFFKVLAISLAPAALAIAAAAKWRRVTDDPAQPRRPSLAVRWARKWIVRTSSHDRSNAPRTLRVRWHERPSSPVQVVRSSLGGLFAVNFFGGDPVLTAGRSAFIVFMLILFASLYVWPWFRSSTFLGIVYGVAFATSGLLWAGYFKDIARFARSASGEFAELALMPGLGSGRTLRFALYRAVLGTPLRWLAAILVAGTIILLLEGGSLSSVRTLILMMVIIALAYSDHALLMLTSRRLRNAFRSGVVAFATVGTFLPVTFVGNEAWRWSWLHELMMGVVLAALALGIYIPVRKLAAAPHPFIG